MGALTTSSNHKRANPEPFTSISKSHYSPTQNLNYFPVSKKPKISNFSSMSGRPNNRGVSGSSISSRLQLYPDVIKKIEREIHAPTRSDRFGFSAKKEAIRGDRMGNWFFREQDNVEGGKADTSRYFYGEGKEVMEIDEEGGSQNGNVVVKSESSLEMIEVLENGVEEQQKSREKEKETEAIAAKYRELDERNRVEENPSSSSKLFESLSLDRGGEGEFCHVDNGIPVYKKLHNDSNKRNDNLNRIENNIKVVEKTLATLKLFHPEKKQEDVTSEAFLLLNEDEENEVDRALSNNARRKTLVTHEKSNIQITGEVLQCLQPRAWLNDEVINVYLELLKEREEREPKKYLKCHFFNTFFYKKLIGGRTGYDYKAVRRWTTQRKLGYCLYDCDKIFVPVHKEIHWCLAVINKKEEKFQYLDSLGGYDKQVMKVLAQYIVDEVKDKSGKDINVSSWKQEYVKELPNQENGYDCGMFMIKYVDFYSRNIGLCFNQEHMPYFRKRTAKEILRLKAD